MFAAPLCFYILSNIRIRRGEQNLLGSNLFGCELHIVYYVFAPVRPL